jgi:mannose-6-phosphate isomerase-like protein (cupin superfamily)
VAPVIWHRRGKEKYIASWPAALYRVTLASGSKKEISMVKVIDHATQPSEDWRQGVRTVMLVSAVTEASQLCIFEQYCEPGLGAPTHQHSVEEVLTVVAGEAEIWVGDETLRVRGGQSVVVPAGHWHGFKNVLDTTLHVRATIAAPVFEAGYVDRNELTRRYLPPGITPV